MGEDEDKQPLCKNFHVAINTASCFGYLAVAEDTVLCSSSLFSMHDAI